MTRKENASDLGRYLARIAEYVTESFVAAGNPLALRHSQRTLDWLLRLDPEAGIALQSAALSHDIERAFREEEVYRRMFASPMAFRDPVFLEYHQRRSAGFIADFLAGIGAPPTLCEKVATLVRHHEVGGDSQSDLLKDADSLSFFEVNTDLFITVKVQEAGIEAVRQKFDWMFSRLSTAKARKLCQPFYKQALSRLEKKAKGEP